MISPKETKNLDIYGDPPLEWKRVIDALDKTKDLEVTDSASHYWIATTRPDGRPHVMGVGLVWDDGRLYMASGAGTQKSRNLARDPRCTVSVAAPGVDIVAEGEAKIIRDEAELQRIAKLFEGWGPAGPRRRVLARLQRAERRSTPVGRVRDHADDLLRGGHSESRTAPRAGGCEAQAWPFCEWTTSSSSSRTSMRRLPSSSSLGWSSRGAWSSKGSGSTASSGSTMRRTRSRC